MYEEWKMSMLSKPKLRTYIKFKSVFQTEPYVKCNISKYKRSLFAQFRIGILPIELETGRFRNVKDTNTGKFRKVIAEERLCKICNTGLVEDEEHFLIHCPIYTEFRQLLFNICNETLSGFAILCNNDKLIHLMNCDWRPCLEFITEAWFKRKSILYV